jgi:hypothetical protein
VASSFAFSVFVAVARVTGKLRSNGRKVSVCSFSSGEPERREKATGGECNDFWRLRGTPSGFGQRRAAGKFGERGVADVLEIGDADFAGVESVAVEVAHEGQENHTRAESGVGFGILAESDEVEDGFSLVGGAIQIWAGVAVGAETIEPIQAATESQLIFFVFAGEQIDKFGGAGFDGSAGFFVLGDDGFAKGG